jgi:lipoprotein-releasing system permease protein
MSLEFFIAQRIHFRQDKKNISRPAVRIAIIGIALGLAVMIVSVAVVIGFKQEIRNKTIGFGGHIQVVNIESINNYDSHPIKIKKADIEAFQQIDDVKAVQLFATKPGIIKTDDAFQGIVLKGVDQNFDWTFFVQHLVEGEMPTFSPDSVSNKILISKQLARLMKLEVGNQFFTYFVNEQVRARRFVVGGIYETNFTDFDKLFLLTDMRHIQQINAWNEDEISGVEVLIHDFSKLDIVADKVYDITQTMYSNDDTSNEDDADLETVRLFTQTIKDINPQIFGWLDLLDMNVWVILILMLAVAGFNMISGLLILILERTNMIGILKSLGATNWSVRKIFLYHSFFLISKGMLWGNAIGLSICALQYFFNIIPLDAEAYYVNSVPIVFNWTMLILLNVGTLLASILMMIGPSYLITKILPAKIIRYE